jgi:hypothetical protein
MVTADIRAKRFLAKWMPVRVEKNASNKNRYQNKAMMRSQFSAFCCDLEALTFDKITAQRTPHA